MARSSGISSVVTQRYRMELLELRLPTLTLFSFIFPMSSLDMLLKFYFIISSSFRRCSSDRISSMLPSMLELEEALTTMVEIIRLFELEACLLCLL